LKVSAPPKPQSLTIKTDGSKLVDGQPQTKDHDLQPVGRVVALPGGKTETGPLGPISFLNAFKDAQIETAAWGKKETTSSEGKTTVYTPPAPKSGADLLTPGGYPPFSGVRTSLKDPGEGWHDVFRSLTAGVHQRDTDLRVPL